MQKKLQYMMSTLGITHSLVTVQVWFKSDEGLHPADGSSFSQVCDFKAQVWKQYSYLNMLTGQNRSSTQINIDNKNKRMNTKSKPVLSGKHPNQIRFCKYFKFVCKKQSQIICPELSTWHKGTNSTASQNHKVFNM
jgi:hypothetical protein